MHRELSCSTLISQKFLRTKNGEAVDVAVGEMDRVDDDGDESDMDEYEGEKSSETSGV